MKGKSFRNIFIAFILNLSFSIFELLGGLLTNSISIISDSVHDFGDAISILVSLILEKKSNKKADEDYTFGYLRYSVLGALLTSTILLIGSVIVMVSALNRIINPTRVHYDGMIILAIVGVIINLIASKITAHSDNINEDVVSLHMLEDVLGWGCILIGSIIIKITEFYIIDPILSLGVSLFILINVFKKFRVVFDILLEKKPSKIKISDIRHLVLKIKYVCDVHHIHIWSMDGVTNYITLHILIDENNLHNLEEIKKEINKKLIDIGISHSTIEFEIRNCNNKNCKQSNNIDIHVHEHKKTRL